MRIEIKAVNLEDGTTKAGKPYQYAEVDYKNDRGETKSKKVMPFFESEPVFKAVQAFKRGDIVDVETRKNGEYIDWIGVEAANDEPPASKVVGNERPAEPKLTAKASWDDADKARQQSIVRQSSLKAAVEFFEMQGNGATLGDVFEVAGKMVQFVDGTLTTMPANYTDDLPDSDIPD